jgi:hypothetical protein
MHRSAVTQLGSNDSEDAPAMTSGPAYCTILAANYLPKAVTLAASLDRHHPGTVLTVLLIDAKSEAELPEIPPLPGVRLVSTAALGIPEREVLHLATIYNLVEFATAVKPLLLKELLADSEQAAYLDPDTYLTSPMVELPIDLAATEGGILLTPHFLEPIGAGADLSEGHLLTVGVYNLGFCAVDRRSLSFLDWWWGHLKEECLWDPLSGLFVDQKWCDIGAPLFRAGTWRHYGYNVGVANLHERPVGADADGYVMTSSGDRLRLFHFHAFDPDEPEELSTRSDESTAHLRKGNPAVDALCVEYAAQLIKHRDLLPEATPYPYNHDMTGRRISRHLRRAYRTQVAASGDLLPSPFLAEDAAAYDAWRKSARTSEARGVIGETAKSMRLAFPDEYGRAKKKFPKLAEGIRKRFVHASGIWN